MRFFIEFDPTESGEGIGVGPTPNYIELESHVRGVGRGYIYLMPEDTNTVDVVACWGHEWDPWINLMMDEKMGEAWGNAFAHTYPLFAQLYQNNQLNHWGEAAASALEDPDDREQKWNVMTVVGNLTIDPHDAIGLAGQPRIQEAYRRVFGTSFDLAVELTTNEMTITDKALLYGKSLIQSHVEGLRKTADWVDLAKKVAGMLSN